MVPWAGQKRLPEADALLLHARALYKASLCPCGCGFPRADTLDPDADGCVEIDDSAVCVVRAALDEWSAEKKDRPPGVLPLPVFDEKSLRISRARSARRVAGADGADHAEEQ